MVVGLGQIETNNVNLFKIEKWKIFDINYKCLEEIGLMETDRF